MKNFYIILTGAIKNVGDFLIADRSKKLITSFISKNLIEFNRWEPLDKHLDLINSSKGIIICGGPGYAENMYPSIYPLVKDLHNLKVPIIPLGVGWSGKPADKPLEFKFDRSSKKLMDYIDSYGLYSCRDNLTQKILIKEGYKKVIMTGCPVWYDMDYIGRPVKKLNEIKSVVFTTPADPKLFFETIKLIELVKSKFPQSKLYVTFHRGIKRDKHTSWKSSLIYSLLAKYAEKKGFEVKDVSYDLSKIDFYQNCDLHIGYRVHAHLYFLSKRKPSILICEDGRGIGMVETMKLPAFKAKDINLINKLSKYIDKNISNEFEEFTYISEFIDKHFIIMKDFLKKIKKL